MELDAGPEPVTQQNSQKKNECLSAMRIKFYEVPCMQFLFIFAGTIGLAIATTLWSNMQVFGSETIIRFIFRLVFVVFEIFDDSTVVFHWFYY